jgi:hypothetical protein
MGFFSLEKNPGIFSAKKKRKGKKSWIFSIFSMKELTVFYNLSKGEVSEKFLI